MLPSRFNDAILLGGYTEDHTVSAKQQRAVHAFDNLINSDGRLVPNLAAVRGRGVFPPMLFSFPKNDQYIGPTLKFGRRPFEEGMMVEADTELI